VGHRSRRELGVQIRLPVTALPFATRPGCVTERVTLNKKLGGQQTSCCCRKSDRVRKKSQSKHRSYTML
jgi:hypothetical protein